MIDLDTSNPADADTIASGLAAVLAGAAGLQRQAVGGALSRYPSAKLRHLVRAGRRQVRAAMSAPPTVTLGTSHLIAPPLHWPATQQINGIDVPAGASFSYCRAGGAIVGGSAYPDYLFQRFSNVSYGSNRDCDLYQVSFLLDGRYLEICFKGQTGSVLCKVDDEYVSLTPQAVLNDGNIYFWHFDFGSRRPRRIDFISSSGRFGGVFTERTATVTPAPLRGPRVIVVGDSFTEGAGASGVDGYVMAFSDALGWDDVWPSGVGSTGYLAAPAPKVNYRARFAADVAAFRPDIVLFTGGVNDIGGAGASQIGTEAALLFGLARAALPDALLVSVAPFGNKGAAGLARDYFAIKQGLRSAMQGVGGLVVDLLEQQLPLNYLPGTATLVSPVAAGVTALSTSVPLALGNTYRFADGTRFQVIDCFGSGPYTVTTDSVIQTAQPAGAVLQQVGNCFWTGSGRVGATTGYGNCDLYVSADGVHPSPAGHLAIGEALAGALIQAATG